MISSLFPQLATFAYGPQAIAVALVTPLVFLIGCLASRLRALRPTLLVLAPVPALAAAILAADSGPLVLDQTLFPAVFVLDPAGALLLGVSALLWIAAGVFAASVTPDEMRNGWFAACWLLTLIGNVGVFLSADVVSFYLVFALVSLPAYGLITLGRGGAPEKAGRLYLSVALLGEAFLIVAFAALALGAPDQSLLISDGVAALPTTRWRDAVVGLLIAGFATKIGTFPFHVWMPSTYRTAPIPASTILSGAAVNAGVIGLIRFLPFGVEVAGWGQALVVLGMFGAFYGVAIGLTQRDAKTVLAYSSVSQMGLVAATLGNGLAGANAAAAGAAALYAAHHGLAKGGLFLATGVVMSAARGRRAWTLPLIALLALSLAGLPPMGGAIAKLAIKAPLGGDLLGVLSTLSAVATTLLMLHFVARLRAEPLRGKPETTLRVIAPWLAVTLASVVVPTAYFLADAPASAASLLNYRLVWEALWPVAAGAALAAISRRWLDRAPNAPEGDIIVLLQRAISRFDFVGPYVDRQMRVLQQWPVAAAALLAIATVLAGTGLLPR
ncbi:hypothetical protein LG047_06905 [Methylocystis sp. WRRC1]|uniref:complex I subunit 5 family protein n=1 Tax=Methylocystis sp. WRRC1 TaxID=1732014 RepID=UPI001D13CA50|nr:proton-conducting transporter membrane subunit [Methylocystis sp. WRRC1]MCC3245050.1 hypothetical protein [Methylocystis sp. WRRC1]